MSQLLDDLPDVSMDAHLSRDRNAVLDVSLGPFKTVSTLSSRILFGLAARGHVLARIRNSEKRSFTVMSSIRHLIDR